MKKRRVGLGISVAVFLYLCWNSVTEAAEEPYEIIIENSTHGEEYRDVEVVEAALNALTVPAINCTVKIRNCFVDDSELINNKSFQNGEKMDIICCGDLAATMEWISSQYLLPLDGLLEEYGSGLLSLFGEELNSIKIEDELYVLPMQPCYARAGGIIYNAELASEYGIKIPSHITMEELNDIFEELHIKAPEIYATTQAFGKVNLFEYFYDIETLGYRYMDCGVILDYDTTMIQNFYATEECREYYKMLRSWVEQGYMASDTMTSGQVQQKYFANKEIFCLPVYYTPLTCSEEQAKYEFEIGAAQITGAVCSTSSIWKPVWAISYTSQNPEKAMQFLELIYTDSEISNLLSYGVEGTHYSKVSEHVIVPVETDGMKNYQSTISHFGNQTEMLHWYPANEDTNDRLLEFYDSAQRSKTLGYTFDITPVQLQFVAVNDILELYVPPLECGMVENVEGAIDTLLMEIEKAGIDDIIAENQRQLDEWLDNQ